MKNLSTYEEFLNEGISNFVMIASELVEIAASWTDVDLTSQMSRAKDVNSKEEIIEFYDGLCLDMKDEMDSHDFKLFKEECKSFLFRKVKINV